MRNIITLTTDFGAGSPYVAQMKGVILSICREVELVDISHAIGAQNIREGAIVLADVAPRFPEGTIHVAVVDPGVGTSRRVVYAEIGTQRYIAPDNGLLSRVAEGNEPRLIVEIENAKYWLPEPSHTFHGRDVMAPAAAHLAGGLDPMKLGSGREAMVTLEWPQPSVSSSGVAGEVLYIDTFGNLITNITLTEIGAIGEPGLVVVDCGGTQIRGMVATYGAAMSGETVALFDSQGRLEIAVVGGNAARELHGAVGERVTVTAP
jgi:S-adenosylmethionine hydrolase